MAATNLDPGNSTALLISMVVFALTGAAGLRHRG